MKDIEKLLNKLLKEKEKKKKANIFTDVGFILLLTLFFLLFGAVGYYIFDTPDWLDSFYTSASVMTGVGAADAPESRAAKLFSIGFTLVTNLLFLFIVGYVVHFYLDK